jgi:hypothetical protein
VCVCVCVCVYRVMCIISRACVWGPERAQLTAVSLPQLAQYLYHDQSQASPGEGDRPYDDILVVRELRRLANQVRENKNVGPLFILVALLIVTCLLYLFYFDVT